MFSLWLLQLILALRLANYACAQDERAYSSKDVPLSNKLIASTPSEAWKEIQKAKDHFPPSSHSETSGSLPANDPRTKYIQSWLVATADKAQEFYTKYPNNTNAAAAKGVELDVLWEALGETYATNLFPRILSRATDIVKDNRIDRQKRFDTCQSIFIIALARKQLLPPTIDLPTKLETLAQIAEREFRDLGQVQQLTLLAADAKAEKERPLFRPFSAELTKMGESPYTQGFVFRMLIQVLSLQQKAVGTPLNLEFTAIDGNSVNLAKLQGKTLAMVFWGNSYPESITNLLRLKKLHDTTRASGFQAIGVIVDKDLAPAKQLIAEKGIAWPQYWDGKEMENKVVVATRVIRAGTILLVDKHGLIHDYSGDQSLEDKVRKLISEK